MANTIIGGHKTQLMFSPETAYGTPVTAAKMMDIVESVTVSINNTPIKGGGIGSRAVQYLEGGGTDISLSIKGKISAGYPIIYAIGTPTPTGAGPYVHTVVPATDGEPRSLTIEYAADLETADSVLIFSGCKVNTLTLSCSKDSAVEYTMDLIAKNVTEGTTKQTFTALTDRPLLFSHGALKIPNASAAIADVESVELTLNNNLIRSSAMGSRLQGAYGGLLEYTFTADMNLLGPALIDIALGADGAVDLDVEQTTFQLSFTNARATTSLRSIDIKASVAVIESWGGSSSIDSTYKENVKGSLKYPHGAAGDYVTVTNNTAVM